VPQQAPQQRSVMGAPVAPRPAVAQTAPSVAGPVRVPTGPSAGAPRRPAGMVQNAPAPAAQAGGFAEQQDAVDYGAPSPEDMPASMVAQQGAEPQFRGAPQHARPAVSSAPVSESGSIGTLFRRATGLMRRSLPAEAEAPAPAQRAAAPQQPAPQQAPAPRQAPVQPAEEMGLDIPTFLRRQSN
jgi:cell division protein FtsZ